MLGESQSWAQLPHLSGGAWLDEKLPQIMNTDQKELGDGSFKGSVHGEEESRSPEVQKSLA